MSTDIQERLVQTSQMLNDQSRKQSEFEPFEEEPISERVDEGGLNDDGSGEEGKQVMISHQSDYDDEDEENATGGQYDEDEF